MHRGYWKNGNGRLIVARRSAENDNGKRCIFRPLHTSDETLTPLKDGFVGGASYSAPTTIIP